MIIGVSAICAVLVCIWLNTHIQQSRRIDQARSELVMISKAVESHHNEWGMYPDEGQSATQILVILSTPIRGGGPLLLNLWQGKNVTPRDPWGREYCMKSGNYERPPLFYSAGPNGIDDQLHPGSDDIRITPNKNAQQVGSSNGGQRLH
jgi:Type II secretion system (T2SS), protein G